jgi:ABC-type multidrug transport system ATPase subunit/ABC-type multidrug transport system permease subunit
MAAIEVELGDPLEAHQSRAAPGAPAANHAPARDEVKREDTRTRLLGSRPPVHLRWENIVYEVEDKLNAAAVGGAGIKRILDGISGQAAPGELVAIMGPSGSGKTTLLNLLSIRVREFQGRILVNGVPPPQDIKRYMGYVAQDERFFGPLTVWETLSYAARLKLPAHMTREQREARCMEVLDELDLVKVKDAQVVSTHSRARARALSLPRSPLAAPGRDRRGHLGRRAQAPGDRHSDPEPPLHSPGASGATSLRHSPSLTRSHAQLDEPTSGLDSASALMIVSILHRIASKGNRTVVCTVHQPRASLLTKFDRLLLLAEGKTIFFGPSTPHCLDFFAEHGYTCPRFENPADFLLDLVNTREAVEWPQEAQAADAESSSNALVVRDVEAANGQVARDGVVGADSMKKRGALTRNQIVNDLSAAYVKSRFREEALRPYEPMPAPLGSDGAQIRKYNTDWLNQFVVIFSRAFVYKLREPVAVMTQCANATVLPFLIGTIMWNLPNSQTGAQDRLSAMSFVMLLQSFMCFDILLLFPIERGVYLRENEGGLYSTSAFYFGRTMSEMPFHVLFSFLVAVITYWCFGLQNDAGKFFTYALIVVLLTLAGASMMLFFGSISLSLDQSNLMATFAIVIMTIFDGSWIDTRNIPRGYRWLSNLSFMRWGVQAAVYNEFSGLELSCTEEEATQCAYPNGEEFLRLNHFGDVDVWYNVGVLIIMIVCYRVGAYFGLRFCYTGKSIRERLNS